MRQFIFLVAFFVTTFSVEQLQSENLLHELVRPISKERIIPPYKLEVTFDKTVHLIFPSPVRYIDLGSSNIIAGKADGVENVVRIKAAIKGFKTETNFSVITDEGSFYSFNVSYADESEVLNVEMKDSIHASKEVYFPANLRDIYLTDLGQESPSLVLLIMHSIYQNNKAILKRIESKRFGIEFSMKGIYCCNNLLYFHTQCRNNSNVPFEIDFIRWKIVDKKLVKRTAIQETLLNPLRTYHFITQIQGKQTERTVFAMEKFTMPDDKRLVVELYEKSGGRHQTIYIDNSDIIHAATIDKLQVE